MAQNHDKSKASRTQPHRAGSKAAAIRDLLGVLSDREIAREIGCRHDYVRAVRNRINNVVRYGIQASPNERSRVETEAHKVRRRAYQSAWRRRQREKKARARQVVAGLPV